MKKDKKVMEEDKYSFSNTVKINKIEEFIKVKGLTQEQFAEKCHLSLLQLKKI